MGGKTPGSGNIKWRNARIQRMRSDPVARDQLREIALKNGLSDPIVARKRRYRQLEHEEKEAEKLRQAGYEVYKPAVVCDRIAIKDGKAYFVEFKRPGQVLRPGQAALQRVASEMYIIQVSDES